MSCDCTMNAATASTTSQMPPKTPLVSPSGRVLRNRQYKRAFSHQRDSKRLFTPEIKAHLKDWLIRRRVHPYPNRAEKKSLAQHTGLTYIQICNWFANWRRKLKNVSSEDSVVGRKSWTHRIVTYNERAAGNVEQLSIASEDSIWEGGDVNILNSEEKTGCTDHSYSTTTPQTPADEPQCLTVSSTTSEPDGASLFAMPSHRVATLSKSTNATSLKPTPRPTTQSSRPVANDTAAVATSSCSTALQGKQRDVDDAVSGECRKRRRTDDGDEGVYDAPVSLSKWLTSANNFQPAMSSYSTGPWTESTWPIKRKQYARGGFSHQAAELEAAEALTRLARLHH